MATGCLVHSGGIVPPNVGTRQEAGRGTRGEGVWRSASLSLFRRSRITIVTSIRQVVNRDLWRALRLTCVHFR